MKIIHLRTNHIENPIGFQMEKPVFSWQVQESTGNKTKQARIRIRDEEDTVVYDSGIRTDMDSKAFAADFVPQREHRYYWNVEVWADNGDHTVSKSAFFETAGVLHGQWIRAPFTELPLFQKKFAAKRVKKARLYITSAGIFEAYLNGKRIGSEYLTPYFNDYNHWFQLITFDVTEYIQTENTCTVALGPGWYKARTHKFVQNLFGKNLAFACTLKLTLEDGTVKEINSDTSWLVQSSRMLACDLYDGEYFDSTKRSNSWQNVLCSEDLTDKVMPRLSLPVRIQEMRKPEKVITTPKGETVLDYGQEVTALFCFHFHAKKGTEILVQCAEILQAGNFYNDNLRTAKEELRYLANGEDVTYTSSFTYYGFRYLKVSGLEEVNPEDFQVGVIYSDLEKTGELITSHPKVNRLIENAEWGQKGNFVDVPTDCPQRDERMGWTGDAQVFCATACYQRYTPAFYRKYLYDMLGEQKELKGSVPFVVPNVLDQIHKVQGKEPTQYGSCGWGDAGSVIPYTSYLFYGDPCLLKEEYENSKRWTDWIIAHDDGSHLWNKGFHFADWLALDNFHQGSPFGGTDPYYVASVYYYVSSTYTARMADILGKSEEASYYRTVAQKVKEAFRQEYFTPTGRIAVDTQTAMVLALHFDLAPANARNRLIKQLHESLVKEKMHLTTGFIGTAYLCRTLSEVGLCKDAYDLLWQEDYPSWLYEVNLGATTVWERWNSVLPDGKVSDTGMNSLNHYAYGAIVEWMYRWIAGIQPKTAGFKQIAITPQFDERFRFVKGQYECPYGLIQSAWSWQGEEIELTVGIPFDTEGTIELPNDWKFADETSAKNIRTGYHTYRIHRRQV